MDGAKREHYEQRFGIDLPDVVLEPIWFGRRPDSRADGYKGIINQKDGNLFNISSDIYQVIPYENILELMDEAVNRSPEFGKAVWEIKLINQGSKIKIDVRFPEIEFPINGDIINPRMSIMSSYDLGWKYSGRFGAFQLVCSNGLTIGKVFSDFKKRHIMSLDYMILKDTLHNGMIAYAEQTGLWKKWAELMMPKETYEEIWVDLPFSTKEKEKIEAMPQMGTNLLLPNLLEKEELSMWQFNSFLTQFATHHVKSEIRQVEIEPLIQRTFENYEGRIN